MYHLFVQLQPLPVRCSSNYVLANSYNNLHTKQVDRCYDWKGNADGAIQESLCAQSEGTVREFNDRAAQVRMELMEKGLNSELYWNNDDPKSTVSLVPTSAHTGEGIPDLIWWLTKLVQDRMTEKIM